MTTLIIDTSGPTTHLALASQGILLTHTTIPDSRHLSKFLLPAIETLLPEPPSFLSIGIGPGSFTGTRLGAMVAKALAYAWNLPLVTFSSTLLPDLNEIARFTYEKFLTKEFSTEIELIYTPTMPGHGHEKSKKHA